MTKLTYIDLSHNSINGTFPNISNMLSLQTVLLHHCNFTGSLPDVMNAPLLSSYAVNSNQLIGVIPRFKHVPLLQFIYMDNNYLNGTLDSLWIDMCNIRQHLSPLSISVIILSNNKITGALSIKPPCVCPVNVFIAENNGLSGTIPSWLFCPNITAFNVNHDPELTGNLPFPAGESVLPLKVLGISQTKLQGPSGIRMFRRLLNLQELYNNIADYHNLRT